ncbi:tetratricopeptide repeat protein [Niabella hibiscisoli]|uniref:tetratricopeptide repeat protein n=1 Tax=Niabella hibiscisoli TaxID=1825928 RepID=UPI001F0E9469|nr:tetratricopeptide repeat protein [Niabella hibiscisoli]MCH5715175.1 tetratricopeptide repeat protein [Niabella hibiscisoli]
MTKLLGGVTLFCFIFIAVAPVLAQDNTELKQMHDADQAARMQQPINWDILNVQDSLRKIRAYQLLDSGKVNTGQDYYHAAMIFQHGAFGDTTSSAMAVKLMRKALEKDSSVNRWLLAAAIDRNLMYSGRPQIYGTQYTANMENPKMHLYTIDSTKVTDEERQYYFVDTMAEIRERERKMSLQPLDKLYNPAQPISEAIAAIKREHQKGKSSLYAIDERAINGFGYSLLKSQKTEDALAIFKLNTVLYPDGYNTWDSLGECLLQFNRKNEAIKAYEQSVKLNPKHKAGIETLKKLKAE